MGGQQRLDDGRPLLVGQHAQHPVAGAGGQAVALRVGIQLAAQGEGGGQVVGSVEQQGLASPNQLLQPAGPAGRRKPLPDIGLADRPAPLHQGPQHPQGHGPVARLHGPRQPEGPTLQIQRLQPAQLGPYRRRPGVQHRGHLGALGGADGHGTRLEHAGFFGGDAGWIRPQKLGVVEPHRGKADHGPVGMAGGGIEPAPQSHLQHHQLQVCFREGQKGRGGDQLKRRELVALGDRRGGLQVAAQGWRGDRGVAQPDALGPAHQVGRGVEAGADAGGQQRLVHEGADRALAVGAGHLHGGEATLGMAQLGQGGLQAIEPQVDAAAAEGFDQVGEAVALSGHGW